MFKGYTYRVKKMRLEATVLYACSLDMRLPWYVRLHCYLVAFYVLGQVDFIPDFIPVIGYLDDLILVPAGVQIAKRIVPQDIYNEHLNHKQRNTFKSSMVQWLVDVLMVILWSVALFYAYCKYLRKPLNALLS